MKNLKKFDEYKINEGDENDEYYEPEYGDDGEDIMLHARMKHEEDKKFASDPCCSAVLRKYNELHDENDEPHYDEDGNNTMSTYVKKKTDRIKTWCDIFTKAESAVGKDKIDMITWLVDNYEVSAQKVKLRSEF